MKIFKFKCNFGRESIKMVRFNFYVQESRDKDVVLKEIELLSVKIYRYKY